MAFFEPRTAQATDYNLCPASVRPSLVRGWPTDAGLFGCAAMYDSIRVNTCSVLRIGHTKTGQPGQTGHGLDTKFSSLLYIGPGNSYGLEGTARLRPFCPLCPVHYRLSVPGHHIFLPVT